MTATTVEEKAGRRPRGRGSRRPDRVLANDLARAAARRMGCFIVDARRLLSIYVDLVCEALSRGEAVQIRGLGTFLPLPHRRRQTVRFTACKRLREAAVRAPKPPAGPAALADELALRAAGAGESKSRGEAR